ncbi:MAG: GIY-YIG nuclease family protein [Sphingobacteriales bacterium]|nr:MAG: GIY-YIG nuclease family protein [Sphingobacteriales bacterium]
MPHLYILYSDKIDKYYVGACTNLERRLYEHNIGHSTFTKVGIPWVGVYQETFNTLPEAKKREAFIKKQKSRKFPAGSLVKPDYIKIRLFLCPTFTFYILIKLTSTTLVPVQT